MTKVCYFLWICLPAIIYFSCTYTVEPLPDKFSDIQKRTLDKYCAYSGCHFGDITEAQALLSLQSDSSYNQLLGSHDIQNDSALKKFRVLVVPYYPDSSFLVTKITLLATNGYGDPMPSRQQHLPQNQIDAIISWIKRGAPKD
jgi:hypothetical protein